MLLHPLLEEWDAGLRSADPLAFPGYAAKLAAIEEAGGVADPAAGAGGEGDPAHESVRTGRTEHYVVIENRFGFLGGSMGVVHGEKVVRAFRRAIDLKLPVVCIIRSGGARMQEGMVSLLQLGRTAAALQAHADAGLLSIGVYLSPTTGGVLASYGGLCDVRAVEAGATIGFAGPRVAEATVGAAVGDRSHTADRALEAGLADAVVPTGELRAWVEGVLGLRRVPLVVRPLPEAAPDEVDEGSGAAWAEVLRARRIGRPTGLDVAAALCDSWTELASTDPVTRAGLAVIDGRPVVVVAHDRYAAGGRPVPAGFRLAQRAVRLAGRLGIPVVTLIDTPGAEPGPSSELAGIAPEIARTFAAMAAAPVPTVAVCVGEGGSGGALSLGAADRLLIQEHAVFSVIGPEGAAVILERDVTKAPEVAGRLGMTSADLLELGIVDEVVPDDVAGTVAAIRVALDEAKVGDRERRADSVSEQWLRG